MGTCERNVKVIRRIQFAQTMMGSKDLLLLHLIEQMLSRGANPKFAGAQIVKHCAQLDSIGDSVLFCSTLQLGGSALSTRLSNLLPAKRPQHNPSLHWPPFCHNPFSGVTVENLLTEEGRVKRGPSVIITGREWGKNWLGLK